MQTAAPSARLCPGEANAVLCRSAKSADHYRFAPTRDVHVGPRRQPVSRAISCAAFVNKTSKVAAPSKKRASEVKGILLRDYQKGQYLVTGDLTEAIYTKYCRISDPTGVIWGIKLYQAIIARLFDPKHSSLKLKSIVVQDASNIVATWSKQGLLQLPWKPYLTTQEGKTFYTLDKDGLICVHKQTWDNMTSFQAIKIALTPTSGKKP